MSSMIQIRHVPDDIHKTLKIRAIQNGMTLSDYLLREINQLAKRPTLNDLLARIEKNASVELNYYALSVHRLAQTMCRRLKIVKSRTLSITRISQKLKALCYALKSCNKVA